MKKIIPFCLALLLLLGGCRKIHKDNGSMQSSVALISSKHNSSTETQINNILSSESESSQTILSESQTNSEKETQSQKTTMSSQPSKTESQKPVKDEQPTTTPNSNKGSVTVETQPTTKPVEEIKPAEVNTKGEKPLYFNELTASQKQIYRYMKTAIEEMKTGFFSLGAARNDENRLSDVAIAYRALSADNPEFFWLPNHYAITPDGSAMAFSCEEQGFDYPVTPKEKEQMEKRLKTTVKNLSAEANKLSSRYEKELFFHDWLCEYVNYDTDGTENIYTAYGALINGVAVCEGYSRAMQLLCDSVGIPCALVYGSSRDEGHVWNVVDPGDGWYYLDVTWDDDEKFGVIRHAFFNVTEEEILNDHEIFGLAENENHYTGNDDFNLREYDCNLQTYNYFKKSNLFFVDDYSLNAQMVIDAVKVGKKELEVYCAREEYNEFLQKINEAIYQRGENCFITRYSILGGSLVVWW